MSDLSPRPNLFKLLKQEGAQFYRIDENWQPRDLIPDPYRRRLLKDAESRFAKLSKAEEEFKGLDRAAMYIKILRRMRLTVRTAQFSWNSDDLKFLEAVSSFFSDYGIMLKHLKYDSNRGYL